MEVRSYLFANQQRLASIDLNEMAAAIGLNGAAFTSCLEQAASSVLDDEKREASRLGVSSTPTFFIGRRLADGAIQLITRIPGALDYSYFKRGLDSALAQSR
jgi:predicted DsbA family dithiol-disulfide isomerase